MKVKELHSRAPPQLLGKPILTTTLTQDQVRLGLKSQGADPSPLPLHVATAGKNHLNKEITPSSPLGFARDVAKIISNLGHAALLRRCELPLLVLN